MPFEVPEILRTLRQSDLGSVLGCGRKFYLSKVESLPYLGCRRTMIGTAVHKGLETIYRTLMIGDRLDLNEAKECALLTLDGDFRHAAPAEIQLGEGEDLEQAIVVGKTHALRILDHYITEVLPEIMDAGRPLAVEETLEMTYRGYKLRGTIDLVSGDQFLHDHKNTWAYLNSLDTQSYWSQLARYTWFWTETMGERPKGIQIDLISAAKLLTKANQVESKSIREEDVGTLYRIGKDLVDSALDQIEAGLFPRNALTTSGGICGYCQFRGSRCLGLSQVAPVVAPAEATVETVAA